MEKLKEILRDEPENLRALDIGTRVGEFICVLQESLPGYSSIIGVDTTEAVLNRARGNFKDKRIEFMCMDAENISFEDNSVDVISISNTLHHLSNKEKVLSEIQRVLKPKGIIIINEMISDNQSEKQLSNVKIHHLIGELDTLNGICHNKTFTKQELIKIVDTLNLEKVTVFQHSTHEEQERSENLEEEKEILDQCFKALEISIEKIKDLPQYEKYLESLQNLKSTLYSIGFFYATEVMIVGRKK